MAFTATKKGLVTQVDGKEVGCEILRLPARHLREYLGPAAPLRGCPAPSGLFVGQCAHMGTPPFGWGGLLLLRLLCEPGSSAGWLWQSCALEAVWGPGQRGVFHALHMAAVAAKHG